MLPMRLSYLVQHIISLFEHHSTHKLWCALFRVNILRACRLLALLVLLFNLYLVQVQIKCMFGFRLWDPTTPPWAKYCNFVNFSHVSMFFLEVFSWQHFFIPLVVVRSSTSMLACSLRLWDVALGPFCVPLTTAWFDLFGRLMNNFSHCRGSNSKW